MELGWFTVGEKDTRMVVKFSYHYRALKPIVKWVLIIESSDPTEVCFMKPMTNVTKSDCAGFVRKIKEVLLEYLFHNGFLCVVHITNFNSFVGDNAIVPVCTAEVSLVVVIPSSLRHRLIVHILVDLGLVLLCGVETLH